MATPSGSLATPPGSLATPCAAGIVLPRPEPESEMLQQRPPDRWFSRQSYLPRHRLSAPASKWPSPDTRLTGELPVGVEAPGPLASGSHHQVPSRPPGAFSGNGHIFALHPGVHSLVTWKGLSPSHSRPHLGLRRGPQFSAAGFLFGKASPRTRAAAVSSRGGARKEAWQAEPGSSHWGRMNAFEP